MVVLPRVMPPESERSRDEQAALIEAGRRLLKTPGVRANLRDLLQRTEREVSAMVDAKNICWQRRVAAILAQGMFAKGLAEKMLGLLIEYDEAVRRQGRA